MAVKISNEMTVEKAMERMEEIQNIILDGNILLNESVELFEEAAKLYEFCNKKLNALENRVKIITKSAEEKLEAVPFGEDE